LERHGISVVCPVCGAEPGVPCRDRAQAHDERRQRAAVFAERRIEGIRVQRRRRWGRGAAIENSARLSDGKRHPVVVKRAADLAHVERDRYGIKAVRR
jgi:hypothetical protein